MGKLRYTSHQSWRIPFLKLSFSFVLYSEFLFLFLCSSLASICWGKRDSGLDTLPQGWNLSTVFLFIVCGFCRTRLPSMHQLQRTILEHIEPLGTFQLKFLFVLPFLLIVIFEWHIRAIYKRFCGESWGMGLVCLDAHTHTVQFSLFSVFLMRLKQTFENQTSNSVDSFLVYTN